MTLKAEKLARQRPQQRSGCQQANRSRVPSLFPSPRRLSAAAMKVTRVLLALAAACAVFGLAAAQSPSPSPGERQGGSQPAPARTVATFRKWPTLPPPGLFKLQSWTLATAVSSDACWPGMPACWQPRRAGSGPCCRRPSGVCQLHCWPGLPLVRLTLMVSSYRLQLWMWTLELRTPTLWTPMLRPRCAPAHL